MVWVQQQQQQQVCYSLVKPNKVPKMCKEPDLTQLAWLLNSPCVHLCACKYWVGIALLVQLYWSALCPGPVKTNTHAAESAAQAQCVLCYVVLCAGVTAPP